MRALGARLSLATAIPAWRQYMSFALSRVLPLALNSEAPAGLNARPRPIVDNLAGAAAVGP